MKIIHLTLWGFITASLVGCAIAEGPKEKLSKTAFRFNEGLRWGRYNDVFPSVDPAILDHFTEMHMGWGKSVKITSADIVRSSYDSKERTACLTIKFVWYRKKEMVVYETFTVQNWEYRDGKWWMVAEEYHSGKPF